MRATRNEEGTKLWLSASDTWQWAHRSNTQWPGSTIAGDRVFVAFDPDGDLVDFTLNGRDSDDDVDGYELSAMASDFLRERFGADHPAIR